MESTGKPKLLDLFCCEGGASMGYSRAGFDVYGVDLFEDYTRSRYPFPSHAGDWSEPFRTDAWKEFDVIVASPPCQRYSAATRMRDRTEYPDLLSEVRDTLAHLGVPYVIENVGGTRDAISEASLIEPLELCGCMFDLTAVDDDGITLHLERVRLFESNVPLTAPGPHDHSDHEWVGGVYGGARRDKYEAKYIRKGGYVPPNKSVAETLLGIDWMTWNGLYQAIPPVYTEWIGAQLLAELEACNAVDIPTGSAKYAAILNPS